MKNRFLILLLLLPLFAFAEGLYWVPAVYTFSSGSVTGTMTARKVFTNDFTSVQLAVSGVSHGSRIDSRTGSVYLFGNNSLVSTQSATAYIQDCDSRLYLVSYQYSIINALDNICYQLWNSGFVSSNITLAVESGNFLYFNFNSLAAVSEALVSTNTFWRSSVLNGLSSLSSDVRQLVLNSVSGLSELSSLGSSLDSLAGQYSLVNFFPYALRTNFIEAAGWWYTDAQLHSYDPWNSIGDDLFNSPVNSTGNANVYIDRFNALRGGYNSILQDAFKAYLTKSIADPKSVTNGEFESLLRNPAAAQEILSSSYSTPITNGVMQGARKISQDVRDSLSNNTERIKKQLADWHSFASNGVREVNNNLSQIAVSTSPGVLRNTLNGLDINVQNSVGVRVEGPVNISDSQVNSVTAPLNGLRQDLSTWYNNWSDFYFSSSPEKGWVKFFDLVSDFKDVNHSDLVSIQSCVSNLLVSFSSYTNGLPFAISNAIAGLSISSTNSYLLLSDYADYIHSGGLDALLDVMDDDSYIDLKSEIGSLYHADTAEGYGRWWRYFTGLSTVQANSIFKLSNIFQVHEKLLKDLKRDNSDLDVQDASDPSVFRKLLYSIPSEEDTFSKLSQLTNSIDQSGMASVQMLIPDLTNRFNVAASLYDKDFVLPAEISWELIPADPLINSPARVVTIRPSEHYRLFQMLHFGLAFSYCLVNIILFPKFLLFLVRLFDRVWNKSEKLIYNSTQS